MESDELRERIRLIEAEIAEQQRRSTAALWHAEPTPLADLPDPLGVLPPDQESAEDRAIARIQERVHRRAETPEPPRARPMPSRDPDDWDRYWDPD